MRSDDTDNRGVRWRRWNFPKPVATPRTDTGAYTKPDAISDAHAHADADANAHTNAHAGRRDDGHDYVGGRFTTNTDRAAGDTRGIREQRHARSRDGLQSASGAHRLS